MPDEELKFGPIESTVLSWITRTYQTHEEWKAKAGNIFYNSNGDSDLSRQRLAAIVRSHFLNQKLAAEDVERWSGNTIVNVHIEPPKVSASNAGYVDWLIVADYLLLSFSSPVEEYQEENQRRETDYQQLLGSFNLRIQVIAARQTIRQDPEANDQSILDVLKLKYSNASLTNVKEARKSETKGDNLLMPIEPKRPSGIPLYKPVYF